MTQLTAAQMALLTPSDSVGGRAGVALLAANPGAKVYTYKGAYGVVAPDGTIIRDFSVPAGGQTLGEALGLVADFFGVGQILGSLGVAGSLGGVQAAAPVVDGVATPIADTLTEFTPTVSYAPVVDVGTAGNIASVADTAANLVSADTSIPEIVTYATAPPVTSGLLDGLSGLAAPVLGGALSINGVSVPDTPQAPQTPPDQPSPNPLDQLPHLPQLPSPAPDVPDPTFGPGNTVTTVAPLPAPSIVPGLASVVAATALLPNLTQPPAPVVDGHPKPVTQDTGTGSPLPSTLPGLINGVGKLIGSVLGLDAALNGGKGPGGAGSSGGAGGGSVAGNPVILPAGTLASGSLSSFLPWLVAAIGLLVLTGHHRHG